MIKFIYNGESLNVMSKEDLVSALLYLNGYDAKTPVKTDNLDRIEINSGSFNIQEYLAEFYKDFEDANDKVIIDIGDDYYTPIIASLWKIEQYRDLDGSPYLALKRPTKEHKTYLVIEKTEDKPADFNWSTTEVTTSAPKAAEQTEYSYDFWNSVTNEYKGRYSDTDDIAFTDLD